MSLIDFVSSAKFHYLVIGLTVIYFIYKKSLQSNDKNKTKHNSYTNIILIPLFAYLGRYIIMRNNTITYDSVSDVSSTVSSNISKQTSSLLSSPYPITSMSMSDN
jgi:hypothetical protein